jgi:DNA repair protein RecN (Recombination protein N)
VLLSLNVRNIVLIDSADLHFCPGLNVLTGETGAGKSILLDALGFVLGRRARSSLLRAGTAQGEVAAVFQVDAGHPVETILAEAGLPQGRELILRRIITRDGRRQAHVNDSRVAAETLRKLSDALVEFHGQQDDRGLLDPRGHCRLLDGFAGLQPELAETRKAWERSAAARKDVAGARAALEIAQSEAEYLKHAAGELTELAPQPGEEEALDARRRQLKSAGRIREDIERAASALGPQGAEAPLYKAMRWLEDASAGADGMLDPALEGLSRVLDELGEVVGNVENVLADIAGDPGEVERVEERVFAIRGLARKHQVPPEALADLADDLRARLQAIDDGSQHVAELEEELILAVADYERRAEALSENRKAAAEKLDARMKNELEPLKLGRSVFETEVVSGEPGPGGIDKVRFLVATNPDTPFGPIEQIASGGELARFLLALKVCLSSRGNDLTLVFDEIDRGVGGATADAVGRRLASLGREGQVLVVTHSPQVAARGAHHWMIGKSLKNNNTITEIAPVSGDARTEEIARMLSGDAVTDEARAAAVSLLDG